MLWCRAGSGRRSWWPPPRGVADLDYSPESLDCLAALRNAPLTSSRTLGWRACLLDHVEGLDAAEAHETHGTPDLTVVVATKGEHDLDVFRAGRWHQAVYQVNAVGMTPGGGQTRLRWRNRAADGTPFRTAHLYVPHPLLLEAADHLRRPGRPASDETWRQLVGHDQVVASVVHGLLRGLDTGAPNIFAETAMRWFAADLVWRAEPGGGPDGDLRSPGVLTDKRLARALEFMTAHLADPLTLQAIACEAGVSPFHFARLFRRRLGLSPYAFLTRERMEKARRLLATTDLPVARIGVECGYPTQSSFSAAFTRRFGRSATHVRAQRG